MTAILELRDIRAGYGTIDVLHGVSLRVEAGHVHALLGPNGAGKTTTLAVCSGQIAPSAGQLLLDGREVNGVTSDALARIGVCLIPEGQGVFPNLTVTDNVGYGLRLRGRRRAPEAIMRALDRVGLASYAHTRARTLSGGEAQRVALARALVIDPAALLLDEPTANLDPYNVGMIEEIIRGHGSTTVVLVTHNIFQARRLADRVGLLLGGKLIELLPTDRFFNDSIDPAACARWRRDRA